MSLPSLPFTLYPKRTKTLLFLLVSITFVAGGIVLIRAGDSIGWLCAGFFGLGILVFLVQLHPKSSYLKVHDEGMEYCSLFRAHTLRWSDISEFGVYSLKQHGLLTVYKAVGFNYSADYQRARKGRAVSKALVGFEAGLPDTYGLSAEDLAKLLSAYHYAMSQPRESHPH